MINIPTTELITIQFDVLVYWILSALGAGMIIGFETRRLLSKYRIVNIQKDKVNTPV